MDSQPPETTVSPSETTTEPPNSLIQHPSISLLAFGILPVYPQLSIPSFNISTFPFILRTAQTLDPTYTAANTLLDIHNLLVGKWDAEANYGFSDIIGLAMPVLRESGSIVTKILVPTPCSTSIISSTEGFVVFYLLLVGYITKREEQGIAVSLQTKSLRRSYESLAKRFPEWESAALANDTKRPYDLTFLEQTHSYYKSSTAYFIDLAKEECLPGIPPLRYYDLMATHISRELVG